MHDRKFRQVTLQNTPLNVAALENPTPANAELNALVSQVATAAIDAMNAKGRQHESLHVFMGSAYDLAARLRNDEAEFGRIMKSRGITKPKLDHLYYQVIQAFQPEENRSLPEWKSEASRLKRAFVKAEELGYTSADFVRRIERKELVAGRMISGVNKLIRMAQHSRSLKKQESVIEAELNMGVVRKGAEEEVPNFSRYVATIINDAVSLHERIVAMYAATDAAKMAGVSPDDIRVVLPARPSKTPRSTPRSLSQSLRDRSPRRSHRQSSRVGEGLQELRRTEPSR